MGARAAERELNRTVHAETIAEMKSACFRLMRPNAYGGAGRSLRTYVVVAEELGASCPHPPYLCQWTFTCNN
jgi:alkylation response protein AidB-like acyl-CoA dehydrogenase